MTPNEFKETFDLIAYCEKNFDIVENRGGRAYIVCPFHDEETASCLVEYNRFYCFGCGAKGSSIDFLMQRLGISMYDVLNSTDLSEYVGLEIERTRTVEKRTAPLSMSLVDSYVHNLEHNPERKKYLYNRHFTDEAIRKARIGWGVPVDLYGSKFNRPRYSIPHFDENGKLSGMRYRIDPRFEKEEIKYLAHPGTKGQIYNIHVLQKHKEILYSGSQLDAAALWFGYKVPTIAPPSENSWKQDEWAKLFLGKRVLIMLDNDNTGINSSIKVYKSLKYVAEKVTIFIWPHSFYNKDDTKNFIDCKGIDGIKTAMKEYLV